VRQTGQRLDRLAQAHLVADDHPPLREGEPGAERLVAAQVDPAQRVVQRLALDPLHHLIGQVALGRLDGGRARHELAEEGVVVGGPPLEIRPRIGGTQSGDAFDLVDALRQSGRLCPLADLAQAADSVQGQLAVLAAGEQPDQRIARRTGGFKFGGQPSDQVEQVVADARGRLSQGVVTGQVLQQGGGGGIGGIQRDPEAHLLAGRPAQVVDRGDHGAGSGVADARDAAQFRLGQPGDVADALETGVGQRCQGDPAGGRRPDRVQGQRRQAPIGERVDQRRVGGFDVPLVRAQDANGGGHPLGQGPGRPDDPAGGAAGQGRVGHGLTLAASPPYPDRGGSSDGPLRTGVAAFPLAAAWRRP